jgi:signal peptidase I
VSLARLGDPQRGDIVTFSSPQDGTRLIKRLVALPGDVVAMRAGVLVPALRATERVAGHSRVVQSLQGAHSRHTFGPLTVPPDHYFMLGDNRDNSADSRYVGFVPRALLIARAERVLVSADITSDWMPRLERFASRLH